MRDQRGATGLFAAVVLLVVIAGLYATFLLLQQTSQVDRTGNDAKRLEMLKAALLQFVVNNKRLPCPANPAASDSTFGEEVRTATTGACTYPTGTVPWKTIGAKPDDAIDSGSSQFSYRVYTGSTGNLTQDSGLDVTPCDKAELLPAGRTAVTTGNAGGLCRSTHDTQEDEFYASKGLTVTNYGATVDKLAFVVISHGASGLGGWTANNPRTQRTLPTSANELANTTATGPFIVAAPSAAGVGSSEASFFDDKLAYLDTKELVRQAGLSARDWADSGEQTSTMNTATVAAALGSTPTAATNLGVSTLTFGNARVTGYNTSGATRNLTFSSASDGIGTSTGGGSLGINSSQGDVVRIELAAAVTKFGVTLQLFGVAGGRNERVLFEFYSGTTLVSSVAKNACRTAQGPASFTIDVGSSFTRVDIIPQIPTTPTTGGNSSFYVGAFATCTTGTCNSPLYVAGTNDCP
jgi:hypothetical protein